MSILIPGLEMPKTGVYVMAVDNIWGKDKTIITLSRKDNGMLHVFGSYELVPVPEHGRLIDADALMAEDRQIYRSDGAAIGRRRYIELYEIDDAPTIIPADPAEEGEG